MKIDWKLKRVKNKKYGKVNTILKFRFKLESGDKKTSNSNNAGKREVVFGTDTCMFSIPFEIKSIHNDLIAFAALKIISPFIGDNFEIRGGVSDSFSSSIKSQYKNIKSVNVNEHLEGFYPNGNVHAISFSGGVDSVAVSLLDPKKDSYLILSHIVKHPKMDFIGRNTNCQKKTLGMMPDTFKKIVVETDFPFVTLSKDKTLTVYSDTFIFTLPIILLSEHLNFNRIITGDILEAFTSNLTQYKENLYFESSEFHKSIGIAIKQPLKGMSEIITAQIAAKNGFGKLAVSCEASKLNEGNFDVCGKCMKCFRKGIYNWALNNESLSVIKIKSLEESFWVKELVNSKGRSSLQFAPVYKWAFNRIDHTFLGNFETIKNRMEEVDISPSFVDKIFIKAYDDEDDLTMSFVNNALNTFEKMSEEDITEFRKLNEINWD